MEVFYEFYESEFGEVLIASIGSRVCFTHFCKDRELEFELLQRRVVADEYIRRGLPIHRAALDYIDGKTYVLPDLTILGTPFQRAVLQSLLDIPRGAVVPYAKIAKIIGRPSAVRAVANAIGSNPLEVLVPCHRVVRYDGSLGGYRSGVEIKKRILSRE